LKTNEQVPPKRPYEKPTLRVYGNVRAMTESISKTAGRSDHSGGARKTG
jgi:hypothetical protein